MARSRVCAVTIRPTTGAAVAKIGASHLPFVIFED
jgi:hypothetical protein